MKRLVFVFFVAVGCFSSTAYALTLEEELAQQKAQQLQETLAFVKENPIIQQPVDQMGLVDMWQRIDGLHLMLFQNYAGELPPYLVPEINKRIFSHQSNNRLRGNDDPDVSMLASMIHIHAQLANDYMSGRCHYDSYMTVESFVVSRGRHIAEIVEAKYGNVKKILKPEPKFDW